VNPLRGIADSVRRHADRWLLAGAALALAAAVWTPMVPIERPLFEHVIVIDITQSMNVQDAVVAGKPQSRLAFAKHALRQSLTHLPCGSKVGWGIFTEYRSFLLFTPVEVCANLGELRATLDRIDGRMAWTGNSEVAKGLYSGITIARQLPDRPSIVFVTDGHEAPPINPRHRPRFDGQAGEVPGLVVGVGGPKPMPIPKTDPTGAPLGFWGADEVMQIDPRSAGRGGSVGSERMVEDPDAPAADLPVPPPGSEHLSSLREAYLHLIAGEVGMGYHRLADVAGLTASLTSDRLARPVKARTDIAPLLAALALLLILGRHRERWVLAWRRLAHRTPASRTGPGQGGISPGANR
jgi:mxaL protein